MSNTTTRHWRGVSERDWAKAMQDAERHGWQLTVGDIGRALLFLVLGAMLIGLCILASGAHHAK